MTEPAKSVNFADMEKAVLRFWQEHDTFKRSLELRRGAPEFVFYDGPPFATGLPHYGHLLAGTIKDIVPRYQTMRGYYVERRFGWDCHGLPVEYEMEQELALSGKRDIEALGVGVFNEKCRSIVLRYTREWREIVTRMGRWVDFDRDYKTMDPSYMESIWWVFRQLWDKGLIYEGNKILPYCPRCATPLSNFETNQGYAEVTDPAITVRFALKDEPGTYILAWTTTPWTLPSNLALAVGPDITYVKIRDGDARYILAENRLSAYYRRPEEYAILERFSGRQLAGLRYEPLFPYFAHLEIRKAFRVYLADFVSTEEGTGVVHIAPGFGEEDNFLAQQVGLPTVCPVDEEGRFTADVADYAGRPVKETDEDIMWRLKEERKLVRRGALVHSYPHCWRCDTPLIYRAVSTWFVAVERIKDRLLANNRTVHWVPEHLRDGRFGKWLENARDWAISRNRYWGTPLPIWRSADATETICIGSREELERLSGQRVTDLHKHFVDAIEIPSARGQGFLKRVPQVLDCWFESGAMPYAQVHYPFENKEWFERHFPADFIAEGLDQTRGWFYTLMVLSTALFDRPAFRNVIVNGLVLAADGRKMSKRLKNYPDPVYMLDTYGADALRLYLIHSPVVRAEDLCFSEEGVQHVLRHFLLPWWNAYVFFSTYARVDGWKPAPGATQAVPHDARPLLDRWILSALERLTQDVTDAMDAYDLQRAVRPFVAFLDDLTNWYIRRSRRRFWKSVDDADKASAYATLYEVLLRLSQIAAPFVPFLSETIYRALRSPEMPESVHLCDFPKAQPARRDLALEGQMDTAMTVVRLGRQVRAERGLKVRQPLRAVHVVCRDERRVAGLTALAELVREELNVREVRFGESETDLAALRGKANYRRLGPRLGERVKAVAERIEALESADLARLLEGGSVRVTVGAEEFVLGAEDVVVQREPRRDLAVASEGDLVVALEVTLDEALVREGLAREFVSKVQHLRKEVGLEITDRIRLFVQGASEVREALEAHRAYVMDETLCEELQWGDPGEGKVVWELNGRPCEARLEKMSKGG